MKCLLIVLQIFYKLIIWSLACRRQRRIFDPLIVQQNGYVCNLWHKIWKNYKRVYENLATKAMGIVQGVVAVILIKTEKLLSPAS